EVKVVDPKTQSTVKLPAGLYGIKLAKKDNQLQLSTESLQITRGDTVVASVRKVGPVGPPPPPNDRPILAYAFNGSGVDSPSLGTDKQPVELFDIATKPSDRRTKPGGGVSGAKADLAFDNTQATSHGVFTPGGIARHPDDNNGIDGLMSFTLVGWIKPESVIANNAGIIVNQDTVAEPDRGFTLSAGEPGTLQLQVNPSEGKGVATSTAAYTDTDWFMFAVTYDGSRQTDNVRFYKGTKRDAVAQVGTALTIDKGAVLDDAKPFSIGNYAAPMSDARFPNNGPLDALLDNIRIFGSKTDDSGVLDLKQLEAVRKTDLNFPKGKK
ncbi:MAG: LamG domain-containing protein, partial [Pirellulales bacterium]|nr:LamG domain-containing protein [Pirellulales bacterium]